MVADLHHLNLELDPSFDLNADPDRTCHFDANPDPASHLTGANLRPLVQRPSTTPL
jgi:hypothetical protein